MKKGGIVLLVVGIIVIVLSVLLDVIGLGHTPGFGWNQLVGTLGGVLVVIVGVVLIVRSRKPQST
jgi:hypothetical protein